jgi:hypothetical protein
MKQKQVSICANNRHKYSKVHINGRCNVRTPDIQTDRNMWLDRRTDRLAHISRYTTTDPYIRSIPKYKTVQTVVMTINMPMSSDTQIEVETNGHEHITNLFSLLLKGGFTLKNT